MLQKIGIHRSIMWLQIEEAEAWIQAAVQRFLKDCANFEAALPDFLIASWTFEDVKFFASRSESERNDPGKHQLH